jgi:hypothetical protein
MMLDVLRSTKHPVHPDRPHTSTCIVALDYTGGGKLFNPAHFSRNISSILDSVIKKWSLMQRAGNLATKATSTRVLCRQTPYA